MVIEMLRVNKKSTTQTVKNVRKVSEREMVNIFFPIFLKRSFWNSPPILNAIRPSASSLKKRRSGSER